MRRALTAAVILPVLLLSLSCEKSDDSLSTPGVPNVILPLQVGNAWFYRQTSYDTQGSLVALDTVIERIWRDSLIQGERWYIWETVSGLSMGTTRSDGYWSLVGGVPALTLQYPAQVHETYLITDTGPTVRILAVDTLITVPLGTLSCIAYEQLPFPYQHRSRIDYCAANTGVVRTEEYIHTASGADSLDRRSDLIDLQLH